MSGDAPRSRRADRARRRSQGLLRVESPYPAAEDVVPEPSPAVRARGAAGMLALVVFFGVIAAVLFGLVLLALALAAVTAIN